MRERLMKSQANTRTGMILSRLMQELVILSLKLRDNLALVEIGRKLPRYSWFLISQLVFLAIRDYISSMKGYKLIKRDGQKNNGEEILTTFRQNRMNKTNGVQALMYQKKDGRPTSQMQRTSISSKFKTLRQDAPLAGSSIRSGINISAMNDRLRKSKTTNLRVVASCLGNQRPSTIL